MEIENKNLDVNESENVEETVETPDKKIDASKTFTQEDVNKIVRDRVAREKKENSKLSESWDSEKTELTSQLESYEKIIKGIVDSKKSDIPENFRKLVDKLSIQEQFDWLNDPANKLADKKVIPVTPNASDNKNVKIESKKFPKIF